MTPQPKIEALLLDFDGPVCSVFAGLPAAVVAEQMRELGQAHDQVLTSSDDPLQVLIDAAQHPEVGNAIEDLLVAQEVDAAASSSLTRGTVEVIDSVSQHVPVLIVSNNSEPCIRHFLIRTGLMHRVSGVFGRPFRRPGLMKPNPFLLEEALMSVDVEAGHALFVGDSASDIDAAEAAGVPIIAFANKPQKKSLFAERGIPVIAAMEELLDLLA